jgi:hypothetical protein
MILSSEERERIARAVRSCVAFVGGERAAIDVDRLAASHAELERLAACSTCDGLGITAEFPCICGDGTERGHLRAVAELSEKGRIAQWEECNRRIAAAVAGRRPTGRTPAFEAGESRFESARPNDADLRTLVADLAGAVRLMLDLHLAKFIGAEREAAYTTLLARADAVTKGVQGC